MKVVCIVEDEAMDAERLKKCVERYAQEKEELVSVRMYSSGIAFLEAYRTDADLVFLDIEMPLFNGLEISQKLRQMDKDVSIVFVTNMAQYALHGYKVGALDYIVKPAGYGSVADCMRRAFLNPPRRQSKRLILPASSTDIISVAADEILYIEKFSNFLVFHTVHGDWKMRGTMREAESWLHEECFSLSSSGCLINLQFVERVTKNTVIVRGQELPLARQRKKEFVNDLLNSMGGVIG